MNTKSINITRVREHKVDYKNASRSWLRKTKGRSDKPAKIISVENEAKEVTPKSVSSWSTVPALMKTNDNGTTPVKKKRKIKDKSSVTWSWNKY